SVIAGISGDAFYSWGWRIPFILSIVLVLIGLWIRNGIDETPVFKKARESGEISKVPLIDTFKYQWKTVLLAVGTKVVETAPFYILSTFVISYATGLGYDESAVLNAVAIAALVTALSTAHGIAFRQMGEKAPVHRRHRGDDPFRLP